MEKFQEVIAAQGGDPAVTEDASLLPAAPNRHELIAARGGFITVCDAREVGLAGVRLGAGRQRKEDDVDHGVGITLGAKIGDRVDKGDVLAAVQYRDQARLESALQFLERAFTIGDDATQPELIIGHVG
jgi:thymidine phosphorylase